MSRISRGAGGAVAAVLLALAVPACGQSDPPFIDVAEDDAAMNAAMDEARASLPQFWSRFDARGDGARTDFMVKAGMPAAGGGVEHIWVDLDGHADGQVKGRLANRPLYLGADLEYGSPVEFSEAIVSDWGYSNGDVLYGHFTTRVLIAKQGDSLGDYGLSPTPIESEIN